MVLRKKYFNRIKTVEAGVHTQQKELLKGDETLIGYKTGKLLTKIRNQFFHRLYGNASLSKHLNVKKRMKPQSLQAEPSFHLGLDTNTKRRKPLQYRYLQ